jgi:uncharacterized protein (DUF952 family)
MEPKIIYHLTPADYYNSLPAEQPYRPREFDRDGFIHCTTGEERLLLVADTLYRRVPGEFLLLMIDERKVTSPVKYENSGGILFPHIYGALNRDAIVRVVAVGRREDGTFLPIGEPDSAAENAAATEAWLSQARAEQLLAESADLRARTIERLDQIERAIAALKAPAPATAQAQPIAPIARAVQPEAAQPATVAHPAAPAPSSTLEARVERVERSLHQLAARTESLEQEISNYKAQISKPKPAPTRTRKSITRKSLAKRHK